MESERERAGLGDGVRQAALHSARKVDIRLPGKGNSTPHGARPVH